MHELAFAHVSRIRNIWYCSNPWCGRNVFWPTTFSLFGNQWLPSCFTCNCLGSDV